MIQASSEVIKKVRHYAMEHYGEMITSDVAEYDAESKSWVVALKSNYPRLIRDDSNPTNPYVKYVTIDNLGTVKLDDQLKVLSASSSEDCEYRLESRLDILMQRAEAIMVKASSDQLARTDGARHALSVVITIMDNLLLNHENDLITFQQIEQSGRRNMESYLKLLESLKLVKKVEEGYTYGEDSVSLLKIANGNARQFKTAVLSHIIRESYPAIRSILNITQLEPYIHFDNCYYWKALEAEELLKTKRATIIQRFFTYYGGGIDEFRANSIINELLEVDALTTRDEYLVGVERLFHSMLESKARLSEVRSLST
jgi:hypothetical protein